MSCVHTDYIRCKRVYAIYYYFFVLALQVPLWKTMPRTNRLSRSLHPLIPFSCVCVFVLAFLNIKTKSRRQTSTRSHTFTFDHLWPISLPFHRSFQYSRLSVSSYQTFVHSRVESWLVSTRQKIASMMRS